VETHRSDVGGVGFDGVELLVVASSWSARLPELRARCHGAGPTTAGEIGDMTFCHHAAATQQTDYRLIRSGNQSPRASREVAMETGERNTAGLSRHAVVPGARRPRPTPTRRSNERQRDGTCTSSSGATERRIGARLIRRMNR
jgi:hypothetical protein